jgi:hypothetical protein
MKRFGDEELARLGPVSVGSIDKIYAELDRTLENFERAGAIFWPTPDAVARDPHGAEPEPVHGEVVADFESTVHARFRAKERIDSGNRQSDTARQTQPDKSPPIDPVFHRARTFTENCCQGAGGRRLKFEIRSPKLETISEIQDSNVQNQRSLVSDLGFFCSFEFVSDFEFRDSSLTLVR